MSIRFHLIFTFLLSMSIPVFSETGDNVEKDSRTLLHLLDYLGRDYSNAVSDGLVLNEFEYSEMLEFSEKSLNYFIRLASDTIISDSSQIHLDLLSLHSLIGSKADKSDVSQLSSEIKNKILALSFVKQSAEKWPDLNHGKALYISLCSPCHGEKGDGKGIASIGLNPPPSNFLDEERVSNLAPLQAFNTIKIGLSGTSMAAFDSLSDENTWALAFYLLSIRHQNENETIAKEVNKLISLEEASTLTDNELIARYGSQPGFDLKSIRYYSNHAGNDSPLKRAEELLYLSVDAYKKESFAEADELALKAYLEGIEPVEQRINATDAKLVGELEVKMMKVRSDIKSRVGIEILEQSVSEAIYQISLAEEIIGGQDRSLSFIAFLSASILIREGLEAFLIIIAMLSILRSLKAEEALKWVHGGWITAVLFGIIGWFFVDILMAWNVQSREFMEGFIALFAVFILLYMGFWLHSKTEIGRWKKFIEEKIVVLVDKNNMFGLAAFSFIVVFREAFESVIFLSSLNVDSGDKGNIGILVGVITAAIIVFIMAWGILRIFDRIPLRKVFMYSSVIVLVLAIILTGDGIHALQESGLLGASPAPVNLRISFLGIFPTYECLLSQFFTLTLVISLWLYNKSRRPSFTGK